jgi:chemotaxis protein MotA
MVKRTGWRLEYATVVAMAAAIAVVVIAQFLEGGGARSLWQPTAALVVFGGTLAALFVSYPAGLVRRTARSVIDVFVQRPQPVRDVINDLLRCAHLSRRRGLLALEPEIERASDPFLGRALGLIVDGTDPALARQVLTAESDARCEHDEAPAEVLETAAGYAPTLGILGAVLGLIRVMQSLDQPSGFGTGIAVAFVATVYGVASANLVLLPLATRLRTRARAAAMARELTIEGATAVRDGMNPRLLEQKLRGLMVVADVARAPRQVA